MSSTFDAVLDFVREWWSLIVCAVLLVVLVALLILAISNDKPRTNCKPTGNTRTVWILSGKVIVPITEREYVCTTTEWH